MAKTDYQTPQSKILLLANTAWYLYNFRRPLARALREQGYEIVMVCPPDDSHYRKLEAEGFRCIPLELSRSGVNPLKEWFSLKQVYRIFGQESPTLVHHFTVKCVLYGTIAARLQRVPNIVNSITGLGHLFLSTNWKKKVAKQLVEKIYRKIFSTTNCQLIFQNADDRAYFVRRKIVNPSQCREIPTSGVDLTYFTRGESPPSKHPVILFAARLLKEKGAIEFVEAVKILKQRGIKARFILGGSPDPGNPSSIEESQLAFWRKEIGIEIPGHIENMREALNAASIFALPSYREGGSKAILEASAMELPVVTCDVPGCKNLVDNGETGILVPARDSQSLAAALEKLTLEPELRKKMGIAGRKKIEREFSDKKIANLTIDAYYLLGLSKPSKL